MDIYTSMYVVWLLLISFPWSSKPSSFTQDRKIVKAAIQLFFHFELSSHSGSESPIGVKETSALGRCCRFMQSMSSFLGIKHGIKNRQVLALQFSMILDQWLPSEFYFCQLQSETNNTCRTYFKSCDGNEREYNITEYSLKL